MKLMRSTNIFLELDTYLENTGFEGKSWPMASKFISEFNSWYEFHFCTISDSISQNVLQSKMY